jgi:hypothetical protein
MHLIEGFANGLRVHRSPLSSRLVLQGAETTSVESNTTANSELRAANCER